MIVTGVGNPHALLSSPSKEAVAEAAAPVAAAGVEAAAVVAAAPSDPPLAHWTT